MASVTWVKVKDDITVTVTKKLGGDSTAGDRLIAFLKWVASRPVDPGYGVEGPVDPGYGVPGPGGSPGTPTHPIAPGGSPGTPTHPIAPGGPGGTPEHPIAPGGERPAHPIAPGGGPRPDNSLPGAQPGVDNSLPGQILIDHAEEIAKLILGNCFTCKQPK